MLDSELIERAQKGDKKAYAEQSKYTLRDYQRCE